ncbi:hypothetical protein K7432_001400 [Basidiobolus ranarum]|uniref:DUF5009 domain-containing protein n=1 Tax=Basidiobolus ranarum TaxID=34480 RepID=A0ABR2W9P1_9FUNG
MNEITKTQDDTDRVHEEMKETIQETTLDIEEIPKAKSKRLVSVDVSRGLTVMFMILCNYQPDAFSILEHPEWIGFSVADSIFPNFLFIMGLAIPLAIHANEGKISQKAMWFKVIKRFVIIYLLGIWNNTFPFAWDGLAGWWRPVGVLQRLAICYLVNAVLYILSYKQRKGTIGYYYLRIGFPLSAIVLWIALAYGVNVPWEGCGRGLLTAECSTQSYFDSNLWGQNHNYQKKRFDPEGSLSTVTACVSCWLGVIIGMNILKRRQKLVEISYRYQKIAQLLLIAIFLMIFSYFIQTGIPISKALWTPTFVLLAGGVSVSVLAVFMWAIDVKDFLNSPYRIVRFFFNTCIVVGKNPLIIYVFAENFAGFMYFVRINTSLSFATGGSMSFYSFMYKLIWASWLPGHLASLAWSLSWIWLVYVPIAYFMDWRGWYIRI